MFDEIFTDSVISAYWEVETPKRGMIEALGEVRIKKKHAQRKQPQQIDMKETDSSQNWNVL